VAGDAGPNELIAADNCCVEVRPSVQGTSLPIHTMMLIQHGIYLLENLRLEKLAAAGAYEFAFILQPLKLKGATGSSGAPVAIRGRPPQPKSADTTRRPEPILLMDVKSRLIRRSADGGQ
jgi:Predicted metal-dependent hydrolase